MPLSASRSFARAPRSRFESPARAPRSMPAPPGAPRARTSPLTAAILRTPEDLNALVVALQDDPEELFVPSRSGKRALSNAIQQQRSPAFVRLLIGAGAPLNIPDVDGSTPLRYLLDVEPDLEMPLWNGMLVPMAPGGAAVPAAPYRRQHQVRLVDTAIALLQRGAQAPEGAIVAAPGNEACAACVEQYWDAILAESLRHAIISGRLRAFWAGIAAFLYDGR